MNDFKYAIFDFDGTLADSQWYWCTLMPRIFMEKGYPVTDEDVEANLDCDWLDYHNIFRERFGIKEPLFHRGEELFPRVEEFYRTEVFWKPTVLEYLGELKRRGVVLSICSATREPMIRTALRHLEGEHLFDYVFSTKSIGIEKGDPRCFEYCLAQMGATVENTVLFEDALYSLRTAKSMGMRAYAVQERTNRRFEAEIRATADRFAVRMIEFLRESDDALQ